MSMSEKPSLLTDSDLLEQAEHEIVKLRSSIKEHQRHERELVARIKELKEHRGELHHSTEHTHQLRSPFLHGFWLGLGFAVANLVILLAPFILLAWLLVAVSTSSF